MNEAQCAKGVCIALILSALLGTAYAESISFAFEAPKNRQMQAGRQASVSIGVFVPESDSHDSDYRMYRWREYVSVSNTNLVHSLNVLLEVGSTNISLATLSGTSYDVLFFDANKSIPRMAVGISRSFSWISIYECHQITTNGLVYAVNVSNQVNPIWVGLVYGILVRFDFDAIRRERDIFREAGKDRSFEDVLFSEYASESFEAAHRPRMSPSGSRITEPPSFSVTNSFDFIDADRKDAP